MSDEDAIKEFTKEQLKCFGEGCTVCRYRSHCPAHEDVE